MRVPSRPTLRAAEAASAPVVVPADPRLVVDGPLDPDLTAVLGALGPFRQRLWIRRIVRRTWLALAGILVAELVLWTVARFIPITWAPVAAPRSPRSASWPGSSRSSGPGRPSARRPWPSTARGTWATASRAPSSWPRPSPPRLARPIPRARRQESDAAETDRFVRRQRADALRTVRLTPPGLFKPRLAQRPALAIVVAAVLLVPVIVIPNPQDVVIAQQRQVADAADRQADRLDELAEELDSKGEDSQDPRSRLAEELRQLARQLRDKPTDLDVNLARLGAMEAEVRAQTDPATEQRAASLTSLSRSLSRASTGKPDANKDGDPEEAQQDLEDLGDKLDDMTDAEKAALARELAELQATASQASGAAATALRDAAQSLAQGDTAGARSALDRLGERSPAPNARSPRTAICPAPPPGCRTHDATSPTRVAARRPTASRARVRARVRAGQARARASRPGPKARVKAKVRARVKAKAKARVKVKARVKARAKARVRVRVKARARVRRGRRLECPFARQRHGRQRPGCRTDESEPAVRARRGPQLRLRAVRPARAPRRSVVHRRDRRRRADPAGQPGRVRLEQRLADAIRGRLRRLLPLRPDLARARLRPALGEGPGPRLLQLTRSNEVTARRPARTRRPREHPDDAPG